MRKESSLSGSVRRDTIRVGNRVQHPLSTFIGFYLDQGDEADKALILHSHKVVHKIIAFLQTQLNIVKVDGVTIKSFYQLCEKDSRLYTDDPTSASDKK